MNLKFGVFLAPFHKAGENPTLALERDLELLGWLDELGYDEAWVGEHHSGGWETIASPEMFLAAAGQRTHRLRLGTGVVSLPYHHPFHVADRITLLDHLTHGRAMLGVGPEALGVIIRLLTEEEPITHKGEWFELRDAQLQLKPLQRPTMPIAVASTISPAGMTAAGKHGIGVLSIASYSEEGLNAMPKQWAYCEDAAAEAKQPAPDRANWRVVAPFHLAESKEQAIEDIQEGLLSWNNDYFIHALGVPNRVPAKSGYELAETMMSAGGAVFGTPDDAIAHLRRLTEITGGFGCFLGLGHEWTTREKTRRSYELMARYVMPEMQDLTSWVRRSQSWTLANKESLMAGTRDAIVKAIKENPDAAASVGLGPKKEEE